MLRNLKFWKNIEELGNKFVMILGYWFLIWKDENIDYNIEKLVFFFVWKYVLLGNVK